MGQNVRTHLSASERVPGNAVARPWQWVLRRLVRVAIYLDTYSCLFRTHFSPPTVYACKKLTAREPLYRTQFKIKIAPCTIATPWRTFFVLFAHILNCANSICQLEVSHKCFGKTSGDYVFPTWPTQNEFHKMNFKPQASTVIDNKAHLFRCSWYIKKYNYSWMFWFKLQKLKRFWVVLVTFVNPFFKEIFQNWTIDSRIYSTLYVLK